MDTLLIPATRKTPLIKFSNGILNFRGVFIPVDGKKFLTLLYEFIDLYSLSPCEVTEVHIDLEYTHAGGFRQIINLLKRICTIQDSDHTVKLFWHYEDDDIDMLEAGRVVSKELNFPITLVEE